jgi:hypothetical protein
MSEKILTTMASFSIPPEIQPDIMEIREMRGVDVNRYLQVYDEASGWPGYRWFLLAGQGGLHLGELKPGISPAMIPVFTYVMAKVRLPERLNDAQTIFQEINRMAAGLNLSFVVSSKVNETWAVVTTSNFGEFDQDKSQGLNVRSYNQICWVHREGFTPLPGQEFFPTLDWLDDKFEGTAYFGNARAVSCVIPMIARQIRDEFCKKGVPKE